MSRRQVSLVHEWGEDEVGLPLLDRGPPALVHLRLGRSFTLPPEVAPSACGKNIIVTYATPGRGLPDEITCPACQLELVRIVLTSEPG